METINELIGKLFPGGELGALVLVALTFTGKTLFVGASTFVATQFIKVLFRNRRGLPTLGPMPLRVAAFLIAVFLSVGLWVIDDFEQILGAALIASFLAHITAEYGMAWLREFSPRIYRVVNADPDRRRRKPGRPPRKGERRR